MAKRAFLSFIVEDKDHADGVRLLARTPKYSHVQFFDESIRVPIDSTDATYLKQKISEKIARSSVLVCLVSENTHKSSWIDFELSEASRQGKRIVVMAVKGLGRAVLPPKARELKLTFHPWNAETLGRLIDAA
jgi:hypothetical protein